MNLAETQLAGLTEFWPQLAVILGVLGLALLLWVAMRTRMAPRPPRDHEPSTRPPGNAPAVSSPSLDTSANESTLDQLEHATLQLELKIERLRHLIHQADQRIEQLQLLTTKHTPHPSRDAEPMADAPIEPDPLKRRVYELADAGHVSLEIAQQLEEHVGKVELILALRHRAASSAH